MEWISVNDRLPEDAEVCFVWDGYDFDIMLFDFYRTKKFMKYDYNDYPVYYDNITHWLIPTEPPKEGKQ